MKTEIKFPSFYVPTFENAKGYFNRCIEYQTKDCKGKLLFWVLFDDIDYFTIAITDPIYKSCTPFIYIERTITNHFFFENDKDVEDMLKYPHAISTIGCDDGHKGWRFETKEQLETWVINFIQDAININKKDSFEYPSEFLDYYEENQVWRN